MALPIQSAPKYTISLPSDGKEVKFRPFLVKEQKLLMLAQEENDEGKTMEAIKDLIRTVTFQEVEPETLPIIDMEYLFLKIRAKSVGETANIKLTCNDPSCPDEGRGTGDTVVNIDEVEVVGDEPEMKIMINDEIGIEFRYPTVGDMGGVEQLDQGSQTIEVIKKSIKSIYTEEDVFLAKDTSDKELTEFVENLTVQQLEKLGGFFQSLPRLQKDVSAKCNTCGKDIEKILIGLQNFF